MKRLIIVAAGLVLVIGTGLYLERARTSMLSSEQPAAELPTVSEVPTTDQVLESPQPVLPGALIESRENSENPSARPGNSKEQTVTGTFITPERGPVIGQMIETLVSSQSGFEQKQAAWKRLKEAGQLDTAIAELEQRAANDPAKAENAAALGEAYLKKAGATEDIRQKAILAMKADETLEAALSLDPSNWEARYIKTVGMSYWPTQLNKGQEVIEQFQTLIQQQEAQAPQPQFARTYAWLGDQYQKSGRADYAVQVWERGAFLFPNNEELRNKLATTAQ